MARRVFFSFHYKHVWKVNQIRNIPNIIGTAAAGFQDASLWEEAEKKGPNHVKLLINKGLLNTSVTVVCVTSETANRTYGDYEIQQSLQRGNGLVALNIHHLKDNDGKTGEPGTVPDQIITNGFKAYKYSTKEALAGHIEEAYQLALEKDAKEINDLFRKTL
jgi:hypothetical protein